MTTSRSQMAKEMTPFGKKPAKENPFGKSKAPPFGGKGKAPPFGKKEPPAKGKKPFAFAHGGSVGTHDGPVYKAAPASNPPSGNPLDDGKPSGGGTMKSMGAATRGGRFQGTF